jgi:hypothetical protein
MLLFLTGCIQKPTNITQENSLINCINKYSIRLLEGNELEKKGMIGSTNQIQMNIGEEAYYILAATRNNHKEIIIIRNYKDKYEIWTNYIFATSRLSVAGNDNNSFVANFIKGNTNMGEIIYIKNNRFIIDDGTIYGP